MTQPTLITLQAESKALLVTVLSVASTARISTLLLTPTGVRGISESSTIVLLHETDTLGQNGIPTIAITDVSAFASRLKLVDLSSSKVQVEPSRSGEFVVRIVITASDRTVLTIRCSDPALLKIPSRVKTEVEGGFDIKAEDLTHMRKAQSGMRSVVVFFTFLENEVRYTAHDNNLGSYVRPIADKHSCVVDSKLSFVSSPMLELLDRAMGDKSKIRVHVTDKNYLVFTVDSIRLYAVPSV